MNPFAKTRIVLIVMLASTLTCRADTASKRDREQTSKNAVYEYGPRGPDRSYQSGPHTRIYVSKRSWLDGGTEVLPGERKFSDYAFPPGVSFARENNNRPLDRQPLSPASDLGGFPQRIPLSW
ncbi:hypothetical protein AYJ54_25675 [Bradyrhizobium centrolobii]|uniref:Uncharacterized protein n=3 Tax=Nitrobacteraceae TaxID=41294 RepID=A0A176YUG7_9BRAD|nr:hypothetical protein AYJ54_25675 [Bradyrhizobium centrolobii]OAF10373.1 hypothetical protein AXW67_25860 [Bradyrhizobium neotropicale]